MLRRLQNSFGLTVNVDYDYRGHDQHRDLTVSPESHSGRLAVEDDDKGVDEFDLVLQYVDEFVYGLLLGLDVFAESWGVNDGYRRTCPPDRNVSFQ